MARHSCNSLKAFYRHSIPHSSRVRKETVDIDILVTSRNGDKNHVIYHSNKYAYLENKEVEPVEPVQINICQSNTYRKGLSWLHFDDGLWFQEMQQVKNQQSYIIIFVAYPTVLSSNKEHQPSHNSIPCMEVW